MKLGITATRNGITGPQDLTLRGLAIWMEGFVTEVHHGDAIGGDMDVCEVLFELLYPSVEFVAHPCRYSDQRGFFKHNSAIFPELLPLDRNRIISLVADQLIAFPLQDSEITRSGTWATVRAFRAKGKPVAVVYPNGNIESDGMAWVAGFDQTASERPVYRRR